MIILLLDEALAEALALSIVEKGEQFSYEHISFGSHPSYDPWLGSWGWLSLSHVYQIINDEYMIFREPMPKRVDHRSFIKDLNTDYENTRTRYFLQKTVLLIQKTLSRIVSSNLITFSSMYTNVLKSGMTKFMIFKT